MNRLSVMALGTVALFGSTCIVLADDDPVAGASQMSDSQIRDQLAIDGYAVERLQHKGDRVAVTATNTEGTTKLLVDAQTGQVTVAPDSDDDDDDDD
ncbi:MAG TPA: hypothetical protein VGB82_18720 [Alphaproteobacteria bacterium]